MAAPFDKQVQKNNAHDKQCITQEFWPWDVKMAEGNFFMKFQLNKPLLFLTYH